MGVDIFFVISGFLITRIIKRKAADDNFSLGEFYIRRMRRILPALIATVLMTVFLGLVVLSPDKLTELARTGIWTLPAFQISTFLITSDTLIWKLTASFCCTPGLWQLKNSSI